MLNIIKILNFMFNYFNVVEMIANGVKTKKTKPCHGKHFLVPQCALPQLQPENLMPRWELFYAPTRVVFLV